MKISDALIGVKRLYLDTAPLVYYVEENPIYVERMDAVIKAVENTPIQAVSSAITLTEVLSHPIRLGHTRYEKAYRDILLHSGGFELLPVTVEIADLAAALRARYNLRTPDALHIATAIVTRCDAFLTNDKRLRQANEIRVLTLDELEVDTA
jgi:predicted nucleic acid-binding protein